MRVGNLRDAPLSEIWIREILPCLPDSNFTNGFHERAPRCGERGMECAERNVMSCGDYRGREVTNIVMLTDEKHYAFPQNRSLVIDINLNGESGTD